MIRLDQLEDCPGSSPQLGRRPGDPLVHSAHSLEEGVVWIAPLVGRLGQERIGRHAGLDVGNAQDPHALGDAAELMINKLVECAGSTLRRPTGGIHKVDNFHLSSKFCVHFTPNQKKKISKKLKSGWAGP